VTLSALMAKHYIVHWGDHCISALGVFPEVFPEVFWGSAPGVFP